MSSNSWSQISHSYDRPISISHSYSLSLPLPEFFFLFISSARRLLEIFGTKNRKPQERKKRKKNKYRKTDGKTDSMATQNYKNQLKGQNGTSFKKYWNGRGEKSENTIRIFCRKERLFDFFFINISAHARRRWLKFTFLGIKSEIHLLWKLSVPKISSFQTQKKLHTSVSGHLLYLLSNRTSLSSFF